MSTTFAKRVYVGGSLVAIDSSVYSVYRVSDDSITDLKGRNTTRKADTLTSYTYLYIIVVNFFKLGTLTAK